MQEIESLYSPGIGRHWFDADTMRFFRSRLADVGYQASDGRVYFVSSEKGPHSKRAYTVRCLTGPKGDIKTVGEFQAFGTSATATRYAKGYASGNILLPA
jgi:hypothetical protein